MSGTASASPYRSDTATGLPIPGPPDFAHAGQARRHHRQRLAGAVRIFGRCGYGEGISGDLSVRDPEHPDRFWVNPFGVSFRRVRVADLVCADLAGGIVEGRHPVNPSALVIHAAIYRLRPEVSAVTHAHTVHSRALGSLRQLLEPIDQESAAFYQRQALYTQYDGPSISPERARDIAEGLGGNRALLMCHHGLLTVGGSVDEAAHWFLTYDTCARVQLLARAAGTPQRLTHEQALAAGAGFGDESLGRFSFQLLWDEIVAEHPGLLDE